MGCFDTVWFKCPKCDHAIGEQTKAGECSFADFDEDAVPLAIAADIDGSDVWCVTCGQKFRIIGLGNVPRTVKMGLVRI